MLDTHVWLWWLLGSERLQPQERRSLDRLAASGSSHIAAMSLWEAQGVHRPAPVPAGVQVGARFFLHQLASFSCIRSSIFPAFEFRLLLHCPPRHGRQQRLGLPPPHRRRRVARLPGRRRCGGDRGPQSLRQDAPDPAAGSLHGAAGCGHRCPPGAGGGSGPGAGGAPAAPAGSVAGGAGDLEPGAAGCGCG